jgi:hypothetical protein
MCEGLLISNARSQRSLRAYQLVIAAALYQVDHGRPPEKLAELVPGYVVALPVDPFTGEDFGYRISAGEKIETMSPPLTLVPGQPVLWSDNRLPLFLSVPVWSAKETKP